MSLPDNTAGGAGRWAGASAARISPTTVVVAKKMGRIVQSLSRSRIAEKCYNHGNAPIVTREGGLTLRTGPRRLRLALDLGVLLDAFAFEHGVVNVDRGILLRPVGAEDVEDARLALVPWQHRRADHDRLRPVFRVLHQEVVQ